MIIHDLILDVSIVMGMGSSSAISTSKIMKITATESRLLSSLLSTSVLYSRLQRATIPDAV